MVPSDLSPTSSAGQPTHTTASLSMQSSSRGKDTQIQWHFLAGKRAGFLWIEIEALDAGPGRVAQTGMAPASCWECPSVLSMVTIACQGSKEPNCHGQLLPEQPQQEGAPKIAHPVPAGCICKGHSAHLTVSPAQPWHPSGEVKHWTQLALPDLGQVQVYTKRKNVLMLKAHCKYLPPAVHRVVLEPHPLQRSHDWHVAVRSSTRGRGKELRNRGEGVRRQQSSLCKQQIPPFLLFIAAEQVGQSEGALRTCSVDTHTHTGCFRSPWESEQGNEHASHVISRHKSWTWAVKKSPVKERVKHQLITVRHWRTNTRDRPQNCPTHRKCLNRSSVSPIKGYYWKRSVQKMNLAPNLWRKNTWADSSPLHGVKLM